MTKASIFEVMTSGFAERSADDIADHCEVPIMFVGDAQTEYATTRTSLVNYLERTLVALKDENIHDLKFTCQHTSSVGEALSMCRVRVDRTLGNGSACDPVTETWIIRHTVAGDRLAGVIGLRLMDPGP